MSIIIFFVAYWMSSQSSISSSVNSQMNSAESLPGFNKQAWLLPDDALLGFVEIPAGEFTMGSNPALDRMAYENERWSNLQRQGSVQLSSFYINRYEVTIAQFRQFVEDTGIAIDPAALQGDPSTPVSSITWPQAIAYTQWLEGKMRNSPQTPAPLMASLEAGAKISLPTEAEWEKAARTDDGRTFPWGSQPTSEFANFAGEGKRSVGFYACASCAFGLSDMAGNVWEMTRSPLQPYPYDAEDDDENLAEDALWVMRGGSYADTINNIRSAVRGGVDPGVRNNTIGFRVVISPH
ncbi:MAG: SUMF1/EgtB/PvdO family nonheme iron enzyme [Gammaproteobacteria bacterium]|nr:SUMF1/EgtB/PvdO family nonheme iron enzyme [Gammaproteobacteria bacterium]MDD9958886.1 SUMF1/EgtB/PvdO family nonheme iron enzyme [Gammaproteobacteria bacterium]